MRITFEDKSYVEFKKSENQGQVILIISAKDQTNPLKKISNAVEISVEELKELMNGVLQ